VPGERADVRAALLDLLELGLVSGLEVIRTR